MRQNYHIAERGDDKNDTDAERGAGNLFLNDAKSTDRDKAEEHKGETRHVDCGSAYSGE